jgi:hypothetical protein
LINLGGVIGVVVGGAVTFFTADWLVTKGAKHDSHGLSEPESRLPALFPGIFLAVTGLWTFGFCAANPSENAWVGLAVGSGMISAATTTVPSIGFNYVSPHLLRTVVVPALTNSSLSIRSSTPTTRYTETVS